MRCGLADGATSPVFLHRRHQGLSPGRGSASQGLPRSRVADR